nr:hypothetical protein 8 [bacterium]
MADLRSKFGTNTDLENEGVWMDLGSGIKVKIARIKNPKFRKMYERLTRPHERQIRQGTLDSDIMEKIVCQCLAKTVLLDWDGIELDGKKFPYSPENSLKLMQDDGLSDFRDQIADLAGSADIFREEDLQDAEKNLPAGSGGKSGGGSTKNS